MRTLALALFATTPICAQIGGNGSDGPFTPAVNTTLDTAINGGVFQFTTISIPAGVTVRALGPNPLILRVQGKVDIDGVLDASGFHANLSSGGAGGPGGFAGGDGGVPWGQPGEGPGGGAGGAGSFGGCFAGGGGGHATAGTGGSSGVSPGGGGTYGSAYPFDLRGGSGAGGWGCAVSLGGPGPGGGGGGGTVALLADGDGFYNGAAGSILVRALGAVRIVGTIDAEGTPGFFGLTIDGRGFVRIDAYRDAPVITGTIVPPPTQRTLPELSAQGQPTVGAPWVLTSASVPGDSMVLALSTAPANIALPPLGTLLLSPTAGLFVAGVASVPATGVDPLAQFSLPIPANPSLAGLPVHAQAINTQSVIAQPRLTNSIASSIL